jgi:DNA-binding transcriptional regulator YiaG
MEEALEFQNGNAKHLKTEFVTLPPEPRVIKAKEVAKIRKKHGLSQDRFAKVLGVSSGTIRSWEQDQKSPSQAARRLMEVFEIDPSAFAKIGNKKAG